MKDISVIIPTHAYKNRDVNLGILISSLLKKENIEYIGEILIIDNGCTLSGKPFMENRSVIKVIQEPKIGLNNARNCGISNAREYVVAFLDDDVIVTKKWAENLSKDHKTKGVLCVGGQVVLQKNIKLPYWMSKYFTRFLFPPSFPDDSGPLKPPYYLIGANMSFKKDVFNKFGFFDSELDRKGSNLLSNGDTEFIIRMPKESVWYSKDAKVCGVIKTERFTRMFMIRRLFWQGISDYLMVSSNGVSNFYDKDEIFISIRFMKIFISKLLTLKFFECFCGLVRILGYYFGFIYKKRGGQNVTSVPLE